MTNVVVVEDHGWLKEALAEALPAHGVPVVGVAHDVAGALEVIDRTAPDVAVLDIRLPPTFTDEGLTIAERVRQGYPDVGLLVLSSQSEAAYAERLLMLGQQVQGVGYLLKERVGRLADLVDAVHRVAGGGVVIDPEVIMRLMNRHRVDDPLASLTSYERRVLALVAEGRSNLGIAQQLDVKISTVEKHVSNITAKLHLTELDSGGRRTVNVRVLATLAFLRGVSSGRPDP